MNAARIIGVVYFTRGPMLNDRCPHEHRTIDAARRCINRHERATRKGTGGRFGSLREVYRREPNGAEFRMPT